MGVLGSGSRVWRIWVWLVVAAGVGAMGYAAVILRQPRSGDTVPSYVSAAPLPVREAYAFALDRPEVLRYLPCYCGCVNNGHTSNEDCFIKQRLGDGRVIYDPMGST